MIKKINSIKKFNAVTEIMLYKCHGICKYTAKRLQMPFRTTFTTHTDGAHNALFRSQTDML